MQELTSNSLLFALRAVTVKTKTKNKKQKKRAYQKTYSENGISRKSINLKQSGTRYMSMMIAIEKKTKDRKTDIHIYIYIYIYIYIVKHNKCSDMANCS